jgi:hypothetical protein
MMVEGNESWRVCVVEGNKGISTHPVSSKLTRSILKSLAVSSTNHTAASQTASNFPKGIGRHHRNTSTGDRLPWPGAPHGVADLGFRDFDAECSSVDNRAFTD